MNDVQLLLDVRNNKLTVDGILKLNADDNLDDVDLVDGVIHETEYIDVLLADVSEVLGRNVDVVDVNLSRVVNDVVVTLKDGPDVDVLLLEDVVIDDDGSIHWWLPHEVDELDEGVVSCCWWQVDALYHDDSEGVIDAGVIVMVWWLSLFDVHDDVGVLNCFDVEAIGDVNKVLMTDVHPVNVLDEVVDEFIP